MSAGATSASEDDECRYLGHSSCFPLSISRLRVQCGPPARWDRELQLLPGHSDRGRLLGSAVVVEDDGVAVVQVLEGECVAAGHVYAGGSRVDVLGDMAEHEVGGRENELF